tara:strand:+ start:1717 stop:3186 length:1470 start_codon:yes stop_codon:yes gene_type:complete
MENNEICTYIGPRGYTIIKKCLEESELDLIRRELTVTPYAPPNSIVKPESFYIFRESKKKIYIPKFYGIDNYGKPDGYIINSGDDIDINFNGELREKQKPVVEKFIKHAKKYGGGLLELHVGFGKTICALNIISKLKKKTLIIVHKEFLARQWEERIETFIPDATVGRIQGKTINIKGNDIVIAMLQSISMKEYDIDLFKSFGLTIIDECHHISSQVFSRSLLKIVTRYTLGLSATMERKDRLTHVIKKYLGETVDKIERIGNDNVIVKGIEYYHSDTDYSKDERDYRGKIKYTTMIKKLCEFNRRSEFILDVLIHTLKHGDADMQIMIIGHNKTILYYLYDAIVHRNIGSVGYYIGGMKECELKSSEDKKIIVATYSMASEGLDIKTLNTLIMVTPKVDVKQTVGRILRKKECNALVIDIIDQHTLFQRHWKKRKTFYRKQEYKVYRTNMDNFKNDITEWTYEGKKSKKVKKIKKQFNDNQFIMDIDD